MTRGVSTLLYAVHALRIILYCCDRYSYIFYEIIRLIYKSLSGIIDWVFSVVSNLN